MSVPGPNQLPVPAETVSDIRADYKLCLQTGILQLASNIMCAALAVLRLYGMRQACIAVKVSVGATKKPSRRIAGWMSHVFLRREIHLQNEATRTHCLVHVVCLAASLEQGLLSSHKGAVSGPACVLFVVKGD